MEKIEDKIYKNRWMILSIVVMMPFMASLDGSIVNVALPGMAIKLNASMAAIEWVVTSYLIGISATILIFGRLGDMLGKTTIFKWGLVLFSIGSLLCGVSSSLEFLVISRVIQAIGAAGTMSTSQGIITHVFPGNERGRALGISGTFVALGTMFGPPLGGFIVKLWGWQYIFLINVPVGLITFLLALKVFPKGAVSKGEKLDLKGALLFSLSIILFFGGMLRGHERGYNNAGIITAFIVSVLSMMVFILMELRVAHPLLQMDIFKNRLFSISIFTGFISFVALNCLNIIQPFYLQYVLGLSPSEAGMFMMVYPIVLAVVAPISGYLSDKIGSELLTFLGLMFMGAGLVLMSTLNENSSLVIITLFVAALGVGNGLFQSPNNSLVMSTVPKNRLGIAGSVNALVRNLGLVFGVTLATTLLYNRMSFKIGYRVVNYVKGRDDVFIYGMRYVYVVAAVICGVGAIITAVRLVKRETLKVTV